MTTGSMGCRFFCRKSSTNSCLTLAHLWYNTALDRLPTVFLQAGPVALDKTATLD
jgi:hypothetical protein